MLSSGIWIWKWILKHLASWLLGGELFARMTFDTWPWPERPGSVHQRRCFCPFSWFCLGDFLFGALLKGLFRDYIVYFWGASLSKSKFSEPSSQLVACGFDQRRVYLLVQYYCICHTALHSSEVRFLLMLHVLAILDSGFLVPRGLGIEDDSRSWCTETSAVPSEISLQKPCLWTQSGWPGWPALRNGWIRSFGESSNSGTFRRNRNLFTTSPQNNQTNKTQHQALQDLSITYLQRFIPTPLVPYFL